MSVEEFVGPVEPQNVYTLLDSYTNKSIDSLKEVMVRRADVNIRYPQSLAKTNGGIPFTLFMPYKRAPFNKDDKFALSRALQKGDLLYRRLPKPDFAIALPTPTSALKTTYQSNYDEVNLGQSAGLVFESFQNPVVDNKSTTPPQKPASQIFDPYGSVATITAPANPAAGSGLPDFVTGAQGTLSGLLHQAGLALGQAALAVVGADEGAVNVLGGLSNNPFTDRLFKNVEFRQHVFNYTFLPKNKEDSEHIDQIIQLFKYAMLPRPHSTAGFFEFPYEFQITHSIQATTFTLLPSVLETMETDFGGGTDSLKLFKTTSGGKQYPTKITVNLAFKEMVLLNRDRITSFRGKGYFESDDGSAPGDTDVKRYRF